MKKKITVTLEGKALEHFNEIMYSLPKNADGSGECTNSDAINHALTELALFEEIAGTNVSGWAKENYPDELQEFSKNL